MIIDHCVPWPWAIVCIIDNLYGPHVGRRGRGCDIHDRLTARYWKRHQIDDDNEERA